MHWRTHGLLRSGFYDLDCVTERSGYPLVRKVMDCHGADIRPPQNATELCDLTNRTVRIRSGIFFKPVHIPGNNVARAVDESVVSILQHLTLRFTGVPVLSTVNKDPLLDQLVPDSRFFLQSNLI